jgi:hypothetical protein
MWYNGSNINTEENIMAKLKIKVTKTYTVELEADRPLQYDVLMEQAKSLVYNEDANVVFKGISTHGIDSIEFTAEENAQIEKEDKIEKARYDKINSILERLNCDRVIVSLSNEQQDAIVNGDMFATGDKKYQFIYSGGFYYKPVSSDVYHSPMISWEDVLIEANKAIWKSEDFHHVYLEDVRDLGMNDGIRVFGFFFGS